MTPILVTSSLDGEPDKLPAGGLHGVSVHADWQDLAPRAHPRRLGPARAMSDEQAHADRIYGNWLHVDPRMGRDAVGELDRYLRQGNGLSGSGIAFTVFETLIQRQRFPSGRQRRFDQKRD